MAENISAVTPVENLKGTLYKLNLFDLENMKSELDKVEVRTDGKIRAEFSVDCLFNFKVYSYGFIYQLNKYKPAVCVICLVESEKGCIFTKYT